MKNIPKKDLVYFQFSLLESQEKLQWKHDREFSYLGDMYDIVYRENGCDSLKFWCWPDREETDLYRKMKEVVLHSPDHLPWKKQSDRRWLDFQKNIFFAEPPAVPGIKRVQTTGCLIACEKIYHSIRLSSPSPPPEFG